MTGTTYTYRITAEGVDAVKAAFGELGTTLLEFAGIGGLGYMIDNSLKTASSIETMSKQAAMSTTDFQEWTYALQQFNVSQDTAATGMKMLAENAAQFVTQNSGPAKNAFGVLGMSQADVQQAMKDESAFFGLMLQKIGEVKNSAEQLDLAKMLFGRQSGAEFIEPIQAGIDALSQYREEAERLGIVFSQDTIDGARKAEIEINNLETMLRDELAITIDDNADKIAHMAQVGIDMLPAVLAIFNSIVTSAETVSETVAKISASMNDIAQLGPSAGAWLVKHSPLGANIAQLPQTKTDSGPTAADLENTLFGGDSLSADGIAPPIGDPAAAKQAEKMAEANQKVIDSLTDEVTAMNESDRQMAIATAERKLNKDATDDQRQAVADLAGTLYDEKQRMADVKTASADISAAFNDMTFKGEKLGDVLKNLATQLLQLAEKDLFGNTTTNGITNLLNGAMGLFSGGSSYNPATSAPPVKPPVPPGLASGGDASAGNLYTVNEDGMEYFQPSVDGQVIPLGGATGTKITVNNYANANVEAVQNGDGLEIRITNLEQGLQKVNGSIETRALAATQQMFLRSTTYLRP